MMPGFRNLLEQLDRKIDSMDRQSRPRSAAGWSRWNQEYNSYRHWRIALEQALATLRETPAGNPSQIQAAALYSRVLDVFRQMADDFCRTGDETPAPRFSTTARASLRDDRRRNSREATAYAG